MVLCLNSARAPEVALRPLPRCVVLVGALLSASLAAAQDVPAPEPAVTTSPDSAAEAAPPLSADGCPERYLILRVEPSLSEALGHEIGVDLAVELQTRGIAVCTTPRADVSPLALVDTPTNGVRALDRAGRSHDAEACAAGSLAAQGPGDRACAGSGHCSG